LTLVVFATVIPIKGFSRSVLIDLDRQNFKFVPNDMVSIIESIKNGKFEELSKLIPESEKPILESYIKFLLNHDLAFHCDLNEQQLFPDISMYWDFPSLIQCLVVDISIRDFTEEYSRVIKAINPYSVKVYLFQKMLSFDKFLDNLSDKRQVKVIVNNVENVSEFQLKRMIADQRIHVVVLENHKDLNIESPSVFNQEILQPTSISSFNWSIELLTESQAHHTYFNRKLHIGPNGEIKNAPECNETFGYIQDIESPEQLKAIVQTPEFQKYWFVHKEITDVCKDCEFRHMCVDNRLPHQRTENEWYHKTECNYNPYIAKWQGEEGYRTLAECGVISNENGFSIDHEKIAEINKELWGED